jgi:hypothetical protein
MLVTVTSWARDKPIKGTIACTFSPTSFDFTGDGITGSFNTCVGKVNGGNFTSQAQIENLAPLASPVNCPSDTVEYPYAEIVSVSTTSSKDQFFSVNSGNGFLCVNTSTGAFTYDENEFYFGGFGKGANSGGSFHSTGTGQFLSCDTTGKHCFGSSVGTFTGTVNLP